MRRIFVVLFILGTWNILQAQEKIRIRSDHFYYLIDIGIKSQTFLANNQSELFASLLEDNSFYYSGSSREFDKESQEIFSIYSNKDYNNLELWYYSEKRESIHFVSGIDVSLMKSAFEEFINDKSRLFVFNTKPTGVLAYFVGTDAIIDKMKYFLAFPLIFSAKGGDFLINFSTPIFINEQGTRKPLTALSNEQTLTSLLAKSILLIQELKNN